MKVPSKIKVIQLVPELNCGGVERGTLEVANYLVSKGHQSIVISAGGTMVPEFTDQGTRHIQLKVHNKNPFSLLQVSKLRKLFLNEKPDIVHARSRVPAWLCYLALMTIVRPQRPKFITTVHGFYSVSRYSSIMTKGDEVICVSESIKDYVQRNYCKVPEKKLKVIHRGICQEDFPKMISPTEDWLANWYNNYPRTINKKLLLIAGRITQLKGHECFLKLLARLPDDFHGLVVGSIHPKRENYYRNLLKQVREMNLEQRVTFTGACKDMKEIYSISYATLSLNSKPESFGRTVLESLSCGCPVLGYNHGGVGEILKDCYPSGSIPFGNLKLVASSVMADSISDSKIEIPSHFKLDHMLDQILNSYYEILKISKI